MEFQQNAVSVSSLILTAMIAGGMSIALTCTSAGRPLRFLWCLLTRWRWTRWLWKLVRCPHCNSFWSGAVVAFLFGRPYAWCIAQAFTTLFVVFVVQHALLALGHDMTPDEDMEDLVGTKENRDVA